MSLINALRMRFMTGACIAFSVCLPLSSFATPLSLTGARAPQSIRLAVDSGGGSGHQAAAKALMVSMASKHGYRGSFQAIIATTDPTDEDGTLFKFCRILGITPTAQNCGNGQAIQLDAGKDASDRPIRITVNLIIENHAGLEEIPKNNPNRALADVPYAFAGAMDKSTISDDLLGALKTNCLVVLQPFKWGGGERMLRCKGDRQVTYLTSTGRALAGAARKQENYVFAQNLFVPKVPSQTQDAALKVLFDDASKTAFSETVVTKAQIVSKDAELVLHYQYMDPGAGGQHDWPEVSVGVEAALSALQARPANIKGKLYYILVIRGSARQAICAYKAATPCTDAAITEFLTEKLSPTVSAKTTVAAWASFNKAAFTAAKPLYLVWTKGLAPADFNSLMKYSTVTIAEGANTVGFAFANNIVVITPANNSIGPWPAGKGKSLLDKATAGFNKDRPKPNDVKAVMVDAKNPSGNIWKYANALAQTVRNPDNDQVLKALTALGPRL